MRKRVWLQLVMVLALAVLLPVFAFGCGESSPGDVTKEALEKLSDRDFGDIYDMASRDSLERKGKSKEEYVEEAEKSVPEELSISNIEILEEKIDGDKATVKYKMTVKLSDGPEETVDDSMDLVKEDGEWKIKG